MASEQMILETLMEIKEAQGHMAGQIEAILRQTTATNGRVSALENDGRIGALEKRAGLLERKWSWAAGGGSVIGAAAAGIWEHFRK